MAQQVNKENKELSNDSGISIESPYSLNGKIHRPSIILATRIHLGKQAKPPQQSHLTDILTTFLHTASTIQACKSVIAVDPEERIKGYNLVQAIQQALVEAQQNLRNDKHHPSLDEHATSVSVPSCEIILVSPWGNFIPALNALTMWACQNQLDYGNSVIMFISAETSITKEAVDALSYHMDQDTLVVGAALPGHDYRGDISIASTQGAMDTVTATTKTSLGVKVELNGRTCPWNTLAMWNLNKLALLGFPLVSEGIHRLPDGATVAAGIEEVATVLLHQKIHGAEENRAKLVKVTQGGVEWEQDFKGDEQRRLWHEAKMKSKFTRAEVHRSLLGGIVGTVFHY